MASPISPMEAIEIVNKILELYKKIKDCPEEIESFRERMQYLDFYLEELRALLNQRGPTALAQMWPKQKERLQSAIHKIRSDCDEVYQIIKIWDQEGQKVWGGKIVFALGKNPKKLESLAADIDQRKRDLRDTLQLLGLWGINGLLVTSATVLKGQDPPADKKALLSGQPSGQTAPKIPGFATTHVKNMQSKPTDYKNVLFVDPTNVGRSKVAAAYTALVREWTLRTGGIWHVNVAHSAGTMIRHKNDCVQILENLKPPVKMREYGNELPNETAMKSLFDNQYFDFSYKATVKTTHAQFRSRGIQKNLFQKYDYILVFVGREYDNLLRLKDRLIEQEGQDIAPPGKGRILHLGAYLFNIAEIMDPVAKGDGSSTREKWNQTTSQIKLATKAFLKVELGWQKPAQGAPGS